MKAKMTYVLLSALAVTLTSGAYLKARAATRDPSTTIKPPGNWAWAYAGSGNNVATCWGGTSPNGDNAAQVYASGSNGMISIRVAGAKTSMQALGQAWCENSNSQAQAIWAGGSEDSNYWIGVDQTSYCGQTVCTGSYHYADYARCEVADIY